MQPAIEPIRAPRKKKRESDKTRSDQGWKYTPVDLTQNYEVIDWFYFAIVSLAQTDGFREDPQWISNRLGIRASVASSALRKLEHLGLLVRDGRGKLKYASSNFATPSDIPDFAIRKRHHQHLEIASYSLDSDDISERDFSAMTIASTREKIKEAKEKIKKFRRELCAFMESEKKEDVFLLNIQLFPLTEKEGGET